jgi:hypothetical protein
MSVALIIYIYIIHKTKTVNCNNLVAYSNLNNKLLITRPVNSKYDKSLSEVENIYSLDKEFLE